MRDSLHSRRGRPALLALLGLLLWTAALACQRSERATSAPEAAKKPPYVVRIHGQTGEGLAATQRQLGLRRQLEEIFKDGRPTSETEALAAFVPELLQGALLKALGSRIPQADLDRMHQVLRMDTRGGPKIAQVRLVLEEDADFRDLYITPRLVDVRLRDHYYTWIAEAQPDRRFEDWWKDEVRARLRVEITDPALEAQLHRLIPPPWWLE